MTKLIALLGICISTNAIADSWIQLSKTKTVNAYLSTVITPISTNTYEVADMYDYVKYQTEPISHKKWLSIVEINDFNCKTHKFKVKAFVMYSGHLAQGKSVKAVNDATDWLTIRKDTLSDDLWTLVCHRQHDANLVWS